MIMIMHACDHNANLDYKLIILSISFQGFVVVKRKPPACEVARKHELSSCNQSCSLCK